MKDSALVVVDMLYDFIDGSLACGNAENAVSETLKFIQKHIGTNASDDIEILGQFPIVFIRDHHPADHSSFLNHGGTWPSHCVAGTKGGEIHKDLALYATEELTFDKGCEKDKEQYSGFEGINQAGQSLSEVLELLDIQNVYVCGIATEFCVRETCQDLAKAGFKVSLLKDCLAWVDQDNHFTTMKDLESQGIELV